MYQLISVVLSDESTRISNVIYCTDDIIANQYSAAGWCNSIVYTGVSNSQVFFFASYLFINVLGFICLQKIIYDFNVTV